MSLSCLVVLPLRMAVGHRQNRVRNFALLEAGSRTVRSAHDHLAISTVVKRVLCHPWRQLLARRIVKELLERRRDFCRLDSFIDHIDGLIEILMISARSTSFHFLYDLLQFLLFCCFRGNGTTMRFLECLDCV